MIESEKQKDEEYQSAFKLVHLQYSLGFRVYISKRLSIIYRIAWIFLLFSALIIFGILGQVYYFRKVLRSEVPFNVVEVLEVIASFEYSTGMAVFFPLMCLIVRKRVKTSLKRVQEIYKCRILSLETETFIRKESLKNSMKMNVPDIAKIFREAGYNDIDSRDVKNININI